MNAELSHLLLPRESVEFRRARGNQSGLIVPFAMSHIAIHEASGGKTVDWLEHVSDADYGA